MDEGRNRFRGHFFFDPDDLLYQDHFPGRPVVPGSVIIDGFMRAAEGWAGEGGTWTVRDFRFKRFLPPGRYAYDLRRRQDGAIACTLYDRDAVVAAGTLWD